jgi:hypothetical protein
MQTNYTYCIRRLYIPAVYSLTVLLSYYLNLLLYLLTQYSLEVIKIGM